MKTCNVCGVKKNLSQFNKNRTRRDGLQNFCRDCGKTNSRKYYAENRQSIIKQNGNRTIKRAREYSKRIDEFKRSKGCFNPNCPGKETEPCCLQFHHLDPSEKEFTIAKGRRHLSWERIEAEINKCIVLCANCHFKVEAGILKV